MKIGCIVMAAGNARRFGSNKLDARVEGKTLLRRALEAVPAACFDRVVVVTQYPQGMDLAREMGFLPVENPRPDLGLSHTIALGMAHMQDMDGVMFQVSDQPLLRRDSVERLVEAFRRHPDRLAALAHDGVRGNPCLFPASLFPELTALEGDHGGSAVIRRHPDLLLLVEAHTLKELAFFVSTKLSTLETVTGTATHFVLKRYKSDGVIFEGNNQDKRLVVTA